jgi:hypothetical protein
MFDVIADRSRFPVPGLILIVTSLDKSGFLQPSDAALQWLEDTNFTAHISINEMLRQIRFRFERAAANRYRLYHPRQATGRMGL